MELNEILQTVEIYFLLFMCYSIMGWILEVVGKLIQYHRFINRGFLIGPYCPIYGYGGLLITVLLRKYTNDPIVLFILAMLVCSILEYLTSYIMERKFNVRWWDYSTKKFNINGRICLETMIPFGLLGLFISYISNPFLFSILNNFSSIALHTTSGTLFLIFLVDNIVSGNVINKVSTEINKVDKDNTEEITAKVREVIQSKAWPQRRLFNAFPNIQSIREKLVESIEEARTKADETIKAAKTKAEETVKEGKDRVVKTKKQIEKKIDTIKKDKKENSEQMVKEEKKLNSKERKEK